MVESSRTCGHYAGGIDTDGSSRIDGLRFVPETGGFNEPLRPGGIAMTERALAFCELSGEARILDAGCGIGTTTRYLAHRFEKSNVYGLDISTMLLAEARSRCKDSSLIRAGIEALPFCDGTFDAVVSECVLSTMSASSALDEFSRLIRLNGFMILSDLYWKNPWREAPKGFTDGELTTEDRVLSSLEDRGFRLLHWEDRTKDLKRYAAGLIMNQGSAFEMFARGDQLFCTGPEEQRKYVGYYLLVARKTRGKVKLYDE